jgi:antibiotic biosynthesis monooxygenase (ABM) superfamily enzyme
LSLSQQDSAVHITRLNVKQGEVGERVDWLARLMMLGVGDWSVLSAEILPPTATQKEWTLVQRFNSVEAVERWKSSEVRKAHLAELEEPIAKDEVEVSEAMDQSFGTVGSVAVAIVTKVKPGQEKNYCVCEGKYQSAQAKRKGYRGAYLQPPTSGTPGIWTTLIRFDSPEALDDWFTSTERQELLAESDFIVSSTDYQRVGTSFPGWFPQDKTGASGPPNWKAGLLVLLGLYPVVTLEIHYLMPHLTGLNPALAGFLGNVLSVAATTFVTMPASIKAFDKWLFPPKSSPKWMSAAVTCLLVFLYVIEIAIFWSLGK